jgi:hypothetical protein
MKIARGRMGDFLYWSGVVSWAVAGVVGFSLILDWIIDNVIRTFWTKSIFFEFVWDRLKKKNEAKP